MHLSVLLQCGQMRKERFGDPPGHLVDICGTEMLNANHWFVAYDRGPELRIGPWNSQDRVKASARHLCGHKCLYKLVDDFMARTDSAPLSSAVSIEADARPPLNRDISTADPSFTRTGPHRMQAFPVAASHVEESESLAQLINPAEIITLRTASTSHLLRGEAWKRERQRQAGQSAVSRRSIA